MKKLAAMADVSRHRGYVAVCAGTARRRKKCLPGTKPGETARPVEEAAGGDERLPVNKESAIRVVAPLPADMRPVSRSRKAGRRERCRDLHRRKWTAVEDIEALAIPANAGGHKRGYQSAEGSVLARLRPAWRFYRCTSMGTPLLGYISVSLLSIVDNILFQKQRYTRHPQKARLLENQEDGP